MTSTQLHRAIGWTGSAALAVCALPQAITSWRTQSSEGIDGLFLFLWAFGEILLLAYTWPLRIWPLVINYLFNLMCLAVVIWYKF